jgi:hypothetical protein
VAAGSGVRVLADSVGPGGTAAIVVFVLILATIAIFVGLLGSLKRLKQSVSKGTFNEAQAAHEQKIHPGDQATAPPRDAVTPDQGPGGAGA